jgi:hypothetical protein
LHKILLRRHNIPSKKGKDKLECKFMTKSSPWLLLLVLVTLSGFVTACNAQIVSIEATPSATSSPIVVLTNTPTAVLPTATPTLVPTNTPNPTPTATPPTTPTATLTPTPDPYAGLTVADLSTRSYGGGELNIEEVLAVTADFTRTLVSYPSEGLILYGFMNTPQGSGPFPVALMMHGYIPPEQYHTDLTCFGSMTR